MQLGNDGLDDEDVRSLVVATDVVDLAVACRHWRPCRWPAVIHDIQPVADLHTIAVDGQRLMLLGIVDEQRDQLLGELGTGRSCWSSG